MKQIYENRKERDEYDIFGEQVACKLRKLPTNHGKITAQHLINNILWESELGNYDYPNNNVMDMTPTPGLKYNNFIAPIPNQYSNSYNIQPPVTNHYFIPLQLSLDKSTPSLSQTNPSSSSIMQPKTSQLQENNYSHF